MSYKFNIYLAYFNLSGSAREKTAIQLDPATSKVTTPLTKSYKHFKESDQELHTDQLRISDRKIYSVSKALDTEKTIPSSFWWSQHQKKLVVL
jgi:hypothetical protein